MLETKTYSGIVSSTKIRYFQKLQSDLMHLYYRIEHDDNSLSYDSFRDIVKKIRYMENKHPRILSRTRYKNITKSFKQNSELYVYISTIIILLYFMIYAILKILSIHILFLTFQNFSIITHNILEDLNIQIFNIISYTIDLLR